MSARSSSRRLPLAVLAVALAACTPDAPPEAPRDVDVEAVASDADLEGTPVVEITTTGGEARLGLTDDVLYVGLTEQVASQVEKELDEAGDEGGLGGLIAGAVSGVVSGALTTPIQIDLEDIEDVRYENGRLEIEFVEASRDVDIEINDERLNEQFAPEDARRFVEAFDALRNR